MSGTHQLAGAMQDGRFFTSYAPICERNALLASGSDIATYSSAEYRQHLQAKGIALISKTQGFCGLGQQCSDNGVGITDPSTTLTPPYTTDPELHQATEPPKTD